MNSIFALRASGGVYHGQGSLGLVQHRLREHGQVDAFWNLYRSSIQVGDDDVQLMNMQIDKNNHETLTGQLLPREQL